jgi:hypothetical protein
VAEKTEQEKPGSKWVWWSTEESVEQSAISALACFEVAAGIYLYWWAIPYWFDTSIHLLISVLVAPFLLLRSPRSVAVALEAFERFVRNKEEFSIRSLRGTTVVLASAVTSGIASWYIAEFWLQDYERWDLVWSSALVAWIGVQTGIATAAAIANVSGVSLTSIVATIITSTLSMFIAGNTFAAASWIVLGVVAAALASGVYVFGATCIAVVRAKSGVASAAGVAISSATAALGASGVILGIWSHSLFQRTLATIRCLKQGWAQFEENWHMLVWALDFRQPPELLPGIKHRPDLEDFTSVRLLNWREFKHVVEFIIGCFSLIFFFLPAWLYRLSLKSTCWFWWPLVFALNSGRETGVAVTAGQPEKAAARFEQQGKTWRAGFLALLSVTLLLHALGLIPDWNLPVPGVKGGLDFYALVGQMGYLMLPCAVLQAELYFHANFMHPRAAADDLGSGHRRGFALRIGVRNFLLWSGLLVMLAVFAAEWVPVLVPFAELVETRYFVFFPFAL